MPEFHRCKEIAFGEPVEREACIFKELLYNDTRFSVIPDGFQEYTIVIQDFCIGIFLDMGSICIKRCPDVITGKSSEICAEYGSIFYIPVQSMCSFSGSLVIAGPDECVNVFRGPLQVSAKHGMGGKCFFRLSDLNKSPHQVPDITGFFPELHKGPEHRECTPVVLQGDKVACITPEGVLVGGVEMNGSCKFCDCSFIFPGLECFCQVTVNIRRIRHFPDKVPKKNLRIFKFTRVIQVCGGEHFNS